ncbi:WD40-like Beta Propeller [Micractinium conductrix]|uniref:WD40-like Beta Propeller n=1 Tax=Micractinium conductrix TaxID=554055 RepID=A0A2P6V648_9CHLO|nr:WD40-like Beta Propeller [Micractinium conductrix]|eukprot:PSC69558.1 WD40-like Beta Propeller [Micractinium conductrix]
MAPTRLVAVLQLLLLAGCALSADPGTSAANGRIAYAQLAEGPGGVNIYSSMPDGSDVRQLTNNAAPPNAHPAWSPDGRRLAFSRESGGEWNVWTMDADGAGQRPLTAGPLIDIVPSFSPDGRYVVFDSTNATTNLTTLVRVDAADGANRTPLIPADQAPAGASSMGPKVSPDGALLAFASDAGNAPGVWDLWLMEGWLQVPGGPGVALRRLTTGANNSFSRSWSPDGSQLAFSSVQGGVSWVCIVRVDGTGQRCLTNSTGGPDGPFSPGGIFPTFDGDVTPGWSPDSARIAFCSNRGGAFEVYTMDAADGGSVQQVTATSTGQHISLGWQPLPAGNSAAATTATTVSVAQQLLAALLASLALGLLGA